MRVRRCFERGSDRDAPQGRVTRAEFDALAKSIKAVLTDAIRAGGTTLRDYINPDGMPGYFRQKLYVYERVDEPCRVCKTPIRHLAQGQRSTYFCRVSAEANLPTGLPVAGKTGFCASGQLASWPVSRLAKDQYTTPTPTPRGSETL